VRELNNLKSQTSKGRNLNMFSEAFSESIVEANRDMTDIELMTDRASLNNLADVFRAQGSIMVCHVCDDVSEIVAGILVVRASEEAWVLCGPCMRKVPLNGPLAS
jgi:hypothetical protein